MPTVLVSRISLLTPARPGLFTIAATSLIAVPSALHAVAPRRVACEFPEGIVLRSLYLKKKYHRHKFTPASRSVSVSMCIYIYIYFLHLVNKRRADRTRGRGRAWCSC
jgi:hypothetical protein